MGYSLYNQLTEAGVKCVILAPTTMLTEQGQRIKTDSRDAYLIAQCLSYGGYHPVYIPTEQDDFVKEYLRMRYDHKKALKKIKHQIGMFCIRHGYYYEGTKWTIAHLKWLKKLELAPVYQETLDEYLASYEEQTAKIERFDARIEEIASMNRIHMHTFLSCRYSNSILVYIDSSLRNEICIRFTFSSKLRYNMMVIGLTRNIFICF